MYNANKSTDCYANWKFRSKYIIPDSISQAFNQNKGFLLE